MSGELRQSLRLCRQRRGGWLGGYPDDQFRVLTLWNGSVRMAKFRLSWPDYIEAVEYWAEIEKPKLWRWQKVA